MPELPEVETVLRSLRPRLVGRRIEGLRGLFPGVLVLGEGLDADSAAGRRVEAMRRRGKLLLLDVERDGVLGVHLRMTGHLGLFSPAEPLARHTHVVVEVEGGEELRFTDPRRFGRVEWRRRGEMARTPFLSRLGPEPFDLDGPGLRARLARRRGAIKGALLDQCVVAGLGNIYVDEILFAAGVHPLHPADRLRASRIERVCEQMHRVLRAAIEGGGSTISDYRDPEGRAGRFQFAHRVFGREGQPCGACGRAIRKTWVAGRGTHWCPTCQPKSRLRVRGRGRAST